LSGVLKFFLPVSWASWERISTPNSHDTCLFSRSTLEIESLFPRYFNPQGNGLFQR
jgi:hypothetical protein